MGEQVVNDDNTFQLQQVRARSTLDYSFHANLPIQHVRSIAAYVLLSMLGIVILKFKDSFLLSRL